MSKVYLEPLFDLIKSLSKSEKRYFKVFASRHVIGEENQYVRLFDVVDRQSHYNETKILKKANITKQQLSKWTRYLYKLILRSVDIYNMEGDGENKISMLLRHTKILFNKGLYQQCPKLLEKAKKIATRYDLYACINDIYTWEIKLMSRKNYENTSGKDIDEIFSAKRESLEKLVNIDHYRKLFVTIFLFTKKHGETRAEHQMPKAHILMNDPMLEDEQHALSHEAKYYFNSTYSFYYQATGDLINCYTYGKRNVNLLEEAPEKIIEYILLYMSALNNFRIICYNLKKYNEAEKIIEKLKTIPQDFPSTRTEDMQLRLFSYYTNLLDMYITQGEFRKGNKVVKEIKEGIEKYKNKMQDGFTLTIYYNASYLCLGDEQYSEALYWINKALQEVNTNLMNIFCDARILNLIIHYELGNQDLLEYTVKSTYRFLYTRKRLFVLETIVLNFIRNKVPKINSHNQRIEAFKKLREELIEITKDAFEKKALDAFDIISWLESKIENKPFAEIVQRKAREASG